jgi:hypothetical protein
MEILMQIIRPGVLPLLVSAAIFVLSAAAAVAQTPATSPTQVASPRDGAHDFDFNIGTWRTHIARLAHPLSGSSEWVKLEGTVTVRKVWDGRAQLEEIEAEGLTGHWEGLTVFLYNPVAHQWSQTFANSKNGTLGTPIVGEFKDGRGELFSQETFNDRIILTRGTWSEIKPDSHKFEQAFSGDGGKTWETNFIATLDREKR